MYTGAISMKTTKMFLPLHTRAKKNSLSGNGFYTSYQLLTEFANPIGLDVCMHSQWHGYESPIS